MEVVGRVTANATVNTLQGDRQVVNFTIAINDRYKPKGSTEAKKIATFINCSYWIGPTVASFLTKGTLVELSGRIGANAWVSKDGEAKASLTFHVNNLKLHGSGKQANPVAQNAADITEPLDDLPF